MPGVGNPRYRFEHLLLNVVSNPAARVKPGGVDELAWREALQRAGGADNPDQLWPVLAQGFKDLLARLAWCSGLARRADGLATASGASRGAPVAVAAPGGLPPAPPAHTMLQLPLPDHILLP